ncbi:chromate transporter [Enterovirga aerilata]|nr:chromate transporter [Enterovirga sp. DB1703]
MPSAREAAGPSLSELFLGCARISAFAFGGVLPWARYVMVERYRWLTPDEFTDTLALAQLLPGPNIVNMSVAIGARFHGIAGALAAVLGIIGLPVAVVLVLAAFYSGFADVPVVQGALAGMAAAAAGLILGMAGKMAAPILQRRFWPAAPFIALTFVAVALLRLPLWPVLVVLAPLSIAAHWRLR